MAARAGTSTRSRAASAGKRQARKVLGPKAISRIEKSLDAADMALKDLRGELGRGGSALVRDLDKTLKDSRKNLRTLNRSVLKDLEKIQKAATKGTSPRPARKTSAAKPAARKTSAAKPAARKTSSSRSSSASKPRARSSSRSAGRK